MPSSLVSPIKNLVVPRFLALVVVTVLFDHFAIFGLAAGIAAELIYHSEPRRLLRDALLDDATATDVWVSVLMLSIFGAIIAVVGRFQVYIHIRRAPVLPRGQPGRVISLVGVSAFNYVFTAMLLATHPELQTIR